jgi:hypothetical protein
VVDKWCADGRKGTANQHMIGDLIEIPWTWPSILSEPPLAQRLARANSMSIDLGSHR